MLGTSGTGKPGGGGSLTIGPFGSTPNADGASAAGSTLTLQPADGSNPGAISTTDQTIAGQKSFSTLFDIINTTGSNPSLSSTGSDSPYPDGTVIAYRVVSYVTIGGSPILSSNFLDCGMFTIPPGGGGGGVNISFTADSNPNLAGYFLCKSVNGADYTGGDAGNQTSINDEIDFFNGSIPASGYTTDVIIPYFDGTNVYAVYCPNDPIRAKTIILTDALPVASGGTGRGDGQLADSSNVSSVDFYNYFLNYNNVNIYHWSTGVINDSFGATSIDTFNRLLYNNFGTATFDYGNNLFGISGQVIAVYNNGFVFTPISASNQALVAKGFASQLVPILTVEDANSHVLFQVDINGRPGTIIGALTSGIYAKGGGTLFDHYADVGSVSTTETNLYSDSIPALTLGVNGDKLTAIYGVSFVNSTSTKRVRLYFAGTVIFDTGALTISAASEIILNVFIIRDSSTSIRYSVNASTTGTSTATFATVGKLTGLTLSNANIMKITGQAAGAGVANNDVVAQNAVIEFKPAF